MNGNNRLCRRRPGGDLPHNKARGRSNGLRCRFSACGGHPAGAIGRCGLFEDQMAQRTLGGIAMTMIMPDHAECRRHHEDDQHDRDCHTPDSRLVKHLESARRRPVGRQSSLIQLPHLWTSIVAFYLQLDQLPGENAERIHSEPRDGSESLSHFETT